MRETIYKILNPRYTKHFWLVAAVVAGAGFGYWPVMALFLAFYLADHVEDRTNFEIRVVTKNDLDPIDDQI